MLIGRLGGKCGQSSRKRCVEVDFYWFPNTMCILRALNEK